jgi:hypothetical protein
MSRVSNFGRKGVAYDIDTYGYVYTPTEAKKRRIAIAKKNLQKKARRKNRK